MTPITTMPPAVLFERFRGILVICLLGMMGRVALAAPLQFNRDIRPILSDKCFGCHGPDSGHRKAGLRLDIREEAMKAPKSGELPLKPGDPEGSHLLSRVASLDADEVMPPPDSKLPKLTKQEIETLRRWISEGAEYQAHWSFIPVRPVLIPGTGGSDGLAKTDLDRLVFASLAKRGIQARPEARPEALLRRVTLDLSGVPPTPEQVRAFIGDVKREGIQGPYERAVDRLLAAETFGEKMASDWLDVSRYADSFGFQVDRDREVWPWRDWVVGAFNRNLSYRDFVTWQLAGDLLPNPSEEQILATAFNRLHQQEAEGGSVEEEYRVEYICDRVQTFGTAFLGLTLECSKCHDHKFDPITQKEFFQLFAFFDDIDEAGLYSFFSPDDSPTPAAKLIPQKERERLKALEERARSLERAAGVAATRSVDPVHFSEWLLGQQNQKGLEISGEMGRFSFDGSMEKEKKAILENALDPKQTVALVGENRLVEGRFGQAVEFSGDDALDLKLGAFDRVDPFTISLWIKTPDVKQRAVILHRSKAWTDSASRGFELLLEEGRLKWSLIRFWPGDAVSIRASEVLPTDQWVNVSVSSDGSGRAAGLRICVNGKAVGIEVLKDNLSRDIGPVGKDSIVLGERMRDRGFKKGLVDEVRVFSRELTKLEIATLYDEQRIKELLQRAPERLSEQERSDLEETFRSTRDRELSKTLGDLREARAEWVKALNTQREIMVMRETERPKKAFVLFRGQYDQRRDEVFAGTPVALNPFPKDAPRNRLGLAQWLTEPSHPLLARVTVNRLWQMLFGRGLTRTPEDLGSQGAQPEYPEVLDWLSQQFIGGGWDLKALLKTIVFSHIYRQDTVANGALIADDPENVLLARGPRFRMSAEMIRDSFLSVSGLMVPKLGGPPVTPYELSEAFRPAKVDTGEGAFRRSLYTRWRRTAPPPAMMAFDAARRGVCSARRERTNTPLQSLVLLNGPQYVEAARVLGQNLHQKSAGDVEAMVEEGFLACMSRFPDAREKEIAGRLYREQLAYFKLHLEEAKELLKTGQSPQAASVPVPEAAAATILAQALLNHDGSVVKQ